MSMCSTGVKWKGPFYVSAVERAEVSNYVHLSIKTEFGATNTAVEITQALVEMERGTHTTVQVEEERPVTVLQDGATA